MYFSRANLNIFLDVIIMTQETRKKNTTAIIVMVNANESIQGQIKMRRGLRQHL